MEKITSEFFQNFQKRSMECLHCHRKGAKYKGQNKKSDAPYIATAYYFCSHCGTHFSIDKTEGEINPPNDPDQILRRMLRDISELPKKHLKVVYDSIGVLM